MSAYFSEFVGHRAHIVKLKREMRWRCVRALAQMSLIVRQGLFFPKEILPDRWCSLGMLSSRIDTTRVLIIAERTHKAASKWAWLIDVTPTPEVSNILKPLEWPIDQFIRFLKHYWPILPSQLLLLHIVKDLFSSNAILNMQNEELRLRKSASRSLTHI